ncbi:hypothetical protein [Kineococcus sp. R86509]|uniref:hypothetical protein n=1 Tax=Kineococcus sp. R86509 TaxID=3093851 RepID=UPI0036D3F7E1
MPPRLVVPTDDLFAWTLSGRDALLTHPDDDPRTAVSPERYALHHLLARGRHVMAFGPTVVADLLGVLPTDLPTDLPADLEDHPDLHRHVEDRWEATAEHRASLGPRPVPDDECDRRAVHTVLDVVPLPVLAHLLHWAREDWPARRTGWPTHLTWPGGDTRGRFADRPHLLRVLTPTTSLSTAQRANVHACQDAGLEVVLLRVNSLGDLPDPGPQALGLPTTPPQGCAACRPALDVEPPHDLLPGEWPLPRFLSPRVPEQRHDHHLRAHLERTRPAHTVSAEVAALPFDVLTAEALTLLVHPGAWRTSRDHGRRHLAPAQRRHRDLVEDPHLAHEAQHRADAFRDALTSRRDGGSLREAAVAAGWFLALQGFDVLAVRDAAREVERVLRDDTAGPTASALRSLRLLSLGFTGAELLEMHATGNYPDEVTLDFLGVLRG